MTRLTAERLAELYAGTLQLVAEHGFDRVTMDRIAEATHSSKATLYRQWGSKASLVADALVAQVEDGHADPDTGALRSDLIEMVTDRTPQQITEGALVGALMQAAKTDAELGQVLRDQVVALGRQRIDAVIQRAVDRGEVAQDCPGLTHVALLIIAVFVLQPVIDDRMWDESARISYVDDVLLPVLGIH